MSFGQLVAGQTPIDPDEAAGLLPPHITGQAQLNEWEQTNISLGRRWALRQRTPALLDEHFVRQLHRRMFGDTWSWAGMFRSTDKSIGAPWEQIGLRLTQLLANTRWQIDHQSFAADEMALRFHRDLVWIHPFPNGNGRHARLMADLLVRQLGGEIFTWGAKADLYAAGQPRGSYIAALKAADANDYAPLLAFARA